MIMKKIIGLKIVVIFCSTNFVRKSFAKTIDFARHLYVLGKLCVTFQQQRTYLFI